MCSGSCWIKLIIKIAFLILVFYLCLWLQPECSLDYLNIIPPFNTTHNNISSPSSLANVTNHNITVKIRFHNVLINPYSNNYNNISLTLFYHDQSIASQSIGNTTIQGFKVEIGKTRHKMGSVETYGLDWEKAEKATLNKSAKFVVHLVAKVESKKDFAKYSRNWKFEKRVRVDESGKWTSDKRGAILRSFIIAFIIIMYIVIACLF